MGLCRNFCLQRHGAETRIRNLSVFARFLGFSVRLAQELKPKPKPKIEKTDISVRFGFRFQFKIAQAD